MSNAIPTLRESINASNPNRLPDALRSVQMGDLLSLLVQALTPTEAAAAVVANAKTLTNPASMVFDVVATAGTVLGRKKLLIGGAGVVPVTGEVVWNGASGMRFAAGDAVTAANFLYARSDVPPVTSVGLRLLGEQD